MSYRNLPPVEPIPLPSRFSQTLLRHGNRCLRSAYLYAKYRGGMPSHQLDFGTAAHRGIEACLRAMVEQGEDRIPPELAKDLMGEAAASADLTIPAEMHGRLRQIAWHFAEGVAIDPDRVLTIERKFQLEIGGVRVIGKPDVAFLSEDGGEIEVWDYKSGFAMAPEGEVAEKQRDGRLAPKSFQLLLYILLLALGRPVTELPCEACKGTTFEWAAGVEIPDGPLEPGVSIPVNGNPASVVVGACPACDGRGTVDHLDPPLGERAQWFKGFEMYPQFLYDDGIGRRGPLEIPRHELADHQQMLQGLVAKVAAAFNAWDFPAVDGSHCSECPARPECPLPAALKGYRGLINTPEEAAEAASLHELRKKELAADWKEIKGFADVHGPIRFGADLVLDFRAEERRKVDREGMREAARRAAEYGDPFDPDDYVQVSTTTPLRKRKLEPHELEPETEQDRWGPVPF